MKKNNYITITYTRLLIACIFVGLVIAGITFWQFYTSSLKEIRCKEGYTFFENDIFSVCYPKKMKISKDYFTDVDMRRKEVVNFSDKKNVYSMNPILQTGYGRVQCQTIEEFEEHGYTYSRVTYRVEEQKKCGKIRVMFTEIYDNTKTKKIILDSRTLSSYDEAEYINVESSIRLK